jgi:hypothetical protein
MEDYIKKFCILIASHISNPKRIGYLKECLESLLKQTIIIPIYISISFETEILEDFFKISLKDLERNPYINIVIKKEKTAQMRHYYELLNIIQMNHEWIMFCDDDDSYKTNRVENIINSIYYVEKQTKYSENNNFVGVYESHCEKDHKEQRQEYWCYCVNKRTMNCFYDRIKEYPDIIDNKCCDILFGEFLRRLGEKNIFARLDMKLYNYRIEENEDSITGVIKSKQGFYTRYNQHPPLGDPELPEYILDWNDYLYEHLEAYLHDVFLRTVVGCNMETILKAEFRKDYEILEFVDECHVEKMKILHEYLRSVCYNLYDIKIP